MMERNSEYVVRVTGGQKAQPKVISIRGGADMFDRYKMRQLLVQVVGKGKMITTRLLNVDNVAKDLKTEPAYIGAYFGYELGAQAKYDPKKHEAERATISGEHDAGLLSERLRSFIRDCVLCPQCGLPEITLRLDPKGAEIVAKCSSCGHNGSLKTSNPKFGKFMLSHPPSVVNTKEIRAKEKPDPKDKTDPAAPPNGDAKPSARHKKKAPAAAASSSSSSSSASSPSRGGGAKVAAVDSEDDDGDWAVSTDSAAVKARAAELLPSSAVAQLVQPTPAPAPAPAPAATATATATASASAASTASVAEATERLRALVGRQPPASADECAHELAALQLDPARAAVALFDALFSAQNIALRDKIRSHETLLRGPLGSPEAQQAVLERIEGLVQERSELLKKTPALLKQFYDLGLLEEEQLVAWHGKEGSGDMAKAMRKETQQLIDWLKTTEDDQDEEEEQEEQGEDDEEDA